MGTLPVIIDSTAQDIDDPNCSVTLSGDSSIGTTVKRFSTDKLTDSLKDIHENLNELFGSIKSVGDFELQEVKLTLSITAEGGFALIGSAKAGMKGGITLSFKPPH